MHRLLWVLNFEIEVRFQALAHSKTDNDMARYVEIAGMVEEITILIEDLSRTGILRDNHDIASTQLSTLARSLHQASHSL